MLFSAQAALLGVFGLATTVVAVHEDALPSYHYGAPIQIECMNRSSYVLLPHTVFSVG